LRLNPSLPPGYNYLGSSISNPTQGPYGGPSIFVPPGYNVVSSFIPNLTQGLSGGPSLPPPPGGSNLPGPSSSNFLGGTSHFVTSGFLVTVKVEMFDAPLDYNLFLGHSWIHVMHAVVSNLFLVICFPHQGKVVKVDQLAFFSSDSCTSNVPFIEKTPHGYENVDVGLLKYLSLMRTFPIPPPNVPPPIFASINMISTVLAKSLSPMTLG
jgi:hypothetical protein